MTIDTYAICPCGNGKKIKFCKCKDSVGELDSILKMVDGGQVVPALDRLSSVLQNNPDAAWALAVRGRLLLDLREYDSLSENAERFIRLQPSNPLALTQRAVALLFTGDVETATTTLLEALTESGRNVDAFVLDVSTVLAVTLAQRGAFLTARVYATLAIMPENYEGGKSAISVLQQLNESPAINQLVKTVPEPIARPEDASWGERYDEANTLLRSNQVLLAQDKFESLNRTVSQAPSILSGLLTCAIWRGDTENQSELLGKLAQCDSLDFETRAKYLAMSALVAPDAPQLSTPTLQLTTEIDDVEEVQTAMTAHSWFLALPPEVVSGLRESEDDIPPRAAFQILNREKPESLDHLPAVDEVPDAIAMALVFGKQTDRNARLEVSEIRPSDLDGVKSRLGDAVGKELNFQQEDGFPNSFLAASEPPLARLQFRVKPAEASELQREIAVHRIPQTIGDLKLPILGGQSLKELATDSTRELERTAVMRVVEHYDVLSSKLGDALSGLYDIAGLKSPEMIKATDDQIEQLNNEELLWVDPTSLGVGALVYLIQRSRQISSTVAKRRFAKHLLNAELSEEQAPTKIVAYLTLVQDIENPHKGLKLLEEAKEFSKKYDTPIGQLLLLELGLRLYVDDREGFQSTIQELTTKYGQDPQIMAQLQQQLMSYGLIGPDGRPRPAPGTPAGQPSVTPAAAPSSGGGLWTPDGGASASQTSAAAESEQSGGGKIWLPGMD